MSRLIVALNGSPVRGSSVDLLLEAVLEGAVAAGARIAHFRANEMQIKPCQACGPDPTHGTGFCIFHDDMDPVFEALRDAHAVVVGSPIYFDTVSAQLKLIIDRCNCVTPLIPQPGGGHKFVPLLERTRRAVFVTACAEHHRYDLAERTVRGFLKWVGAKWEETIAWVHADDDPGSVTRKPELVERARAVGRRLIESPPLEVPAAAP